jgi:hypothetical protein
MIHYKRGYAQYSYQIGNALYKNFMDTEKYPFIQRRMTLGWKEIQNTILVSISNPVLNREYK